MGASQFRDMPCTAQQAQKRRNFESRCYLFDNRKHSASWLDPGSALKQY